MTIEQLQERISKKEQEITKIEKRIQKWKDAQCEECFWKRYEWLLMGRDRATFFAQFYPDHIKDCEKELDHAIDDLHYAQTTIENYKQQIKDVQAKENTLNDMPETLVKFRDYMISRWDEYDIWKRNQIKKEYAKAYELVTKKSAWDEYRQACRDIRYKWGANWEDFKHLSNEEIHKQNVKDADKLILNLLNRTISITGKIVDTKSLCLSQDNNGFSIINGVVIGENGKAKVESILAGGYNIQRLHVRVLVKEAR